MKTPFPIDTPVVTAEEFARRSGMSLNTVRDKIAAGEIPVVRTSLKPGRRERLLVNLLKLAQLADAAEFAHPAMNGD